MSLLRGIRVSILVLMDSRVKTIRLAQIRRLSGKVSILVLMDSRVKTVLSAILPAARVLLFQSLF